MLSLTFKTKLRMNSDIHASGDYMKLCTVSNTISSHYFPLFNMANIGSYDGGMSEIRLSKHQQKVPNPIKESPTTSGRQMSEMMSVSHRTIDCNLSALQKIGILKHDGKDKNGVWVLVLRNLIFASASLKQQDHVPMFHVVELAE